MNLTFLSVVGAVFGIFYGITAVLEHRLEDFYIFSPDQLHTLSLNAIAKHGNDTRAVVADIVANLQDSPAKAHLNTHEEWVFNNAGGAMGGMYIIHASKRPLHQPV